MSDRETPSPPETPRRPVTEVLHGELIADPYRWLEDDTPEVREWTDAQDAYAERILDTAQRAVLEDRFEHLARVTDYGPVVPAGGRFFGEVAGPADDQPVLYAYDSLAALRAGEGRALVDPNDRDADGTTSVDWFVPGPDGERLAYGVAEGGDEQYDVHVLDAATGEEREALPGVGRTNEGGFAWTDDGFYYVATGAADEGAQLEKELRHHAHGDDPAADPVVADDFDEQVWPVLETDGDALVVACADGWARTDVYAARGEPAEVTLVPVLEGYDANFAPTLAEDTLYVVTDHHARYSRLLAAPLADVLGPDGCRPGDFEELVAERDAVLRGVEPAGERLLAHYHRDARSELVAYDRDGAHEGRVDLPAHATAVGVHGVEDDPVAFVSVEAFAEPPSVRRVDLATGETDTVAAGGPDVPFDVAVSQEWFESADGTDVPAFVVRRAGVEPDGTNPAVLTGYGGFRVNRTPTFDRYRLPFLRAGGVFVLATLRGGTEYGEPWHEAGRRERKTNVFEDALAVAEGLVDRGWAGADRLAVTGGSNGGLLVGALLIRRPGLFRAALCHVPLLDMLRFHRFLLGASWTTEYGSPEDPDAFEYLRAYSPYHNVAEADYPATMFTTALGDTRVHPGHARKMSARLQERTTGSRPVILRVEADAGHGVGKPTSMLVAERAERWGFACAELGVDAGDLS